MFHTVVFSLIAALAFISCGFFVWDFVEGKCGDSCVSTIVITLLGGLLFVYLVFLTGEESGRADKVCPSCESISHHTYCPDCGDSTIPYQVYYKEQEDE